MEVYFNGEEKKDSKIQLGDLFIGRYNNEGYILIDVTSISGDEKIEFPIVLQSLKGNRNYDAYKDFDSFSKVYKSELFDSFEWYPKDNYILELKKK